MTSSRASAIHKSVLSFNLKSCTQSGHRPRLFESLTPLLPLSRPLLWLSCPVTLSRVFRSPHCACSIVMSPKPRVIYWFRTDLRLHDSPALLAALALQPECLWPVWCWDPHYVYRARVGPNRWQYLCALPFVLRSPTPPALLAPPSPSRSLVAIADSATASTAKTISLPPSRSSMPARASSSSVRRPRRCYRSCSAPGASHTWFSRRIQMRTREPATRR